MTLPKFQETNWSELPPEAVAWAVQGDGSVWSYAGIPTAGKHYDGWLGGGWIQNHCKVDMTGIDWRDTLRLRPVVEAPKDEAKQIDEDLNKAGREHITAIENQHELERLAEEAWKALLSQGGSYEGLAIGAYKAAIAFIAEREKRRGK